MDWEDETEKIDFIVIDIYMPKEEQKNIEGRIQEGKIKSVQDILNVIKRKKTSKNI